MSASRALVVGFYLAFALWFTATRYNPPWFYSWLVAPAVTTAMALLTVASFIAVLALVGWRSAASVVPVA